MSTKGGAAAAVAAVYMVLQLVMMPRLKRTIAPWGPRALGVASAQLMRVLAAIFGVSMNCDAQTAMQRIDPSRQYVASWHPHGAFTSGAAFYTNKQLVQSTLPEPPALHNWMVLVADQLFKIPVLNLLLVLWNCRSINSSVASDLLRDGYTVCIQPGGVSEQLITDCEREQMVFPPKLGWIRLAIQHGCPLLPMYLFGENQIFQTYPWLRKRSMQLGLPLVNPLPNRGSVMCLRWGRPIEVIEQQAEPEQWQVERLFALYVLEMARLFNEHKEECLPAAIANRGLTVMWRGHDVQELEALLASVEHDTDVLNSVHISTYPPAQGKHEPVIQSKL